MRCRVRINILNKLKKSGNSECIQQESLNLVCPHQKKRKSPDEVIPLHKKIAELKVILLSPILKDDDLWEQNARKKHEFLKSLAGFIQNESKTPDFKEGL
jgi:hypothetical protein